MLFKFFDEMKEEKKMMLRRSPFIIESKTSISLNWVVYMSILSRYIFPNDSNHRLIIHLFIDFNMASVHNVSRSIFDSVD
jgi:hypothetical protein